MMSSELKKTEKLLMMRYFENIVSPQKNEKCYFTFSTLIRVPADFFFFFLSNTKDLGILKRGENSFKLNVVNNNKNM